MRSFWTGLVCGVLLSIAAAFVLALAFPAFVFQEPEIDTTVVPEGLADPSGSDYPSTPEMATGGPQLKKVSPLIDTQVVEDMSPGLAATAPSRAPDVFDGAGSGSPSLVFPTRTD